MGEDQPRPGRSAVHSMFWVFDQESGRLALVAAGLEEGPRKEGHSGSAAKAEAMVKMVTKTRIIFLLDDIPDGNVSGRDERASCGRASTLKSRTTAEERLCALMAAGARLLHRNRRAACRCPM